MAELRSPPLNSFSPNDTMDEAEGLQQQPGATVNTAGLDAALREVSVALDTSAVKEIPISVVVPTIATPLAQQSSQTQTACPVRLGSVTCSQSQTRWSVFDEE